MPYFVIRESVTLTHPSTGEIKENSNWYKGVLRIADFTVNEWATRPEDAKRFVSRASAMKYSRSAGLNRRFGLHIDIITSEV